MSLWNIRICVRFFKDPYLADKSLISSSVFLTNLEKRGFSVVLSVVCQIPFRVSQGNSRYFSTGA